MRQIQGMVTFSYKEGSDASAFISGSFRKFGDGDG
jgi:hypothetical protein